VSCRPETGGLRIAAVGVVVTIHRFSLPFAGRLSVGRSGRDRRGSGCASLLLRLLSSLVVRAQSPSRAFGAEVHLRGLRSFGVAFKPLDDFVNRVGVHKVIKQILSLVDEFLCN
jgi:hypothetical protein